MNRILYNAEQVKRLFDEHAILFYDQEGVTFYDVIGIFGKESVEWAFYCGDHKIAFPVFSDPEERLWEPFVSYQGFCLVATYANLLELRRMRKESGLKVDPLPDLNSEKPKQTKREKAQAPKVIDIRQMLKNNAATAAQEKVR